MEGVREEESSSEGGVSEEEEQEELDTVSSTFTFIFHIRSACRNGNHQ